MNIKCENCGREFPLSAMGTKNRNHCPFCLFSKHVDQEDGDRKSKCNGLMAPLGLTFKHEGIDKYGRKKTGELMLVHRCLSCGKVSINRIAGDDPDQEILSLFQTSLRLPNSDIKNLNALKIDLLGSDDEQELKTQLFGKAF